MSFFDSENEGTMYNEQEDNGKSFSLTPFLILFGVLFAPALIVAFLFYFITFRLLKLRPGVSALLVALIFGLWGVVAALTHPLEKLTLIVQFSSLSYNWPEVLLGYITLCVPLGILAGLGTIIFNYFQLKHHPELRKMKGWAADFKFRRTPWAWVKRKVLIKRLKTEKELSYDKAPVGIIDGPILTVPEDEEPVITEAINYRYYKEAGSHSLITGSTGSGKTVTMLSLIKNDIVSGKPICLLDFKKSPDVIYFLSKWAKEYNRPFYHFTSGKPGQYKNPFISEQATYDPLSTGSATSKADMMLNLRTWEGNAEVFKKRTQDILQSLFYLLDRTAPDMVPELEWGAGGLALFVSALDTANLFSMIEVMRLEAQRSEMSAGDQRRLRSLIELYNTLTGKSGSALRDQIEELVSNCRTLIMSSYGDWLAEGASTKHINLLDVSMSERAPVVLYSFNPQEEPDFAKYMGSIVMSDLGRVSAIKNAQGEETYFGVYIDEFQTLDPDSVKDLLEKSRSAKFFVTLSLQSLEQIVKAAPVNGEATLNAILDTCSNFIFHNGATEDSAEKMSKIIGKQYKTEYRVTSKMNSKFLQINWGNTRNAVVSKSRVEDWIVPPYEFQHLSAPNKNNKFKAQAYLINKSCSDPRFNVSTGTLARKVQMVVSEELAAGIDLGFKQAIYVPSYTPAQHTVPVAPKPIKQTPEEVDDWEIEETTEFDEQPLDDLLEDFGEEKPAVVNTEDTKALEQPTEAPTKLRPRPNIGSKPKPKSFDAAPKKSFEAAVSGKQKPRVAAVPPRPATKKADEKPASTGGFKLPEL